MIAVYASLANQKKPASLSHLATYTDRLAKNNGEVIRNVSFGDVIIRKLRPLLVISVIKDQIRIGAFQIAQLKAARSHLEEGVPLIDLHPRFAAQIFCFCFHI